MKKLLAISFVLALMISGCIGSPTVDVQADVKADIDIHSAQSED